MIKADHFTKTVTAGSAGRDTGIQTPVSGSETPPWNTAQPQHSSNDQANRRDANHDAYWSSPSAARPFRIAKTQLRPAGKLTRRPPALAITRATGYAARNIPASDASAPCVISCASAIALNITTDSRKCNSIRAAPRQVWSFTQPFSNHQAKKRSTAHRLGYRHCHSGDARLIDPPSVYRSSSKASQTSSSQTV